jgi:hypothetical protein
MADADALDQERTLLISCVEDAYEALHVRPGVDANGPILVWMAEQLLQARRRLAETP